MFVFLCQDVTRLKKPVSKKDIDRAMLPENKDKNRSMAIIPGDKEGRKCFI